MSAPEVILWRKQSPLDPIYAAGIRGFLQAIGEASSATNTWMLGDEIVTPSVVPIMAGDSS